jgi:predicted Zn-dependent protease
MSSVSVAPREFLSPEECKVLFNKIVGMGTGGGDTKVSLVSQWSGSARWARNRMHIASDTRTTDIRITRSIRGAGGSANTSRMDDEGLRQAIREAEASMQVGGEAAEQIKDPFIAETSLNPTLWSESTYGYSAEQRTDLVQSLITDAEAVGLMSAGNLQVAANGTASMGTDGLFRYYPQTTVECSMTVRHPKGTSSGWAGVNHYDLAKIDPKALAARALDKCQRSASPFAVEPGRYTVIMEPQATADLFSFIIDRAMDRQTAEMPSGPFGGKEPGRSKITEQVLDRRLTVRADPMDPDAGFLPYERYSGIPYQPVNWIDQGILRELSYSKGYALAALGLDKALLNSRSYRLSAAPSVPTTTVEEMIAKTERGILVTRFSNVQLIDGNSMLCGGYTRDGTWLIERGKITKPVKNFRFTESPLFVLNNLEDIGTPQRVFWPRMARVAPAVRVRDFSFTSLADAI